MHNEQQNIFPGPLHTRECKCGCGYRFQPKRKNQVYINKQHADFGYNHGKRKEKDANRIRIEKILRKNDRILKETLSNYPGEESVQIPFESLKAKGFDTSYHAGTWLNKDNVTFYFTYNFYYHLNKGQVYILTKSQKHD